jgi:hypothetical protein
MRFRFRSLLLMLLVGIAIGLAIDLLRPKAEARRLPAGEPSVEMALDKRIPEVWLENVPLEVAAKQITELSGVPINIDEVGMRASGMFPPPKVNVRLKNATLANVLNELNASMSNPQDYYIWYSKGQSITITAAPYVIAGGSPLPASTRVYDVRDLLAKRIPCINDSAALAAYRQALVAAQYPNSPGPPRPPEEPSEALAKLIVDTVMPDLWIQSGGATGSLKIVGGVMIVTHDPQAHRQIRLLLEQLRQMARQAEGPPAPLEDAKNLMQRWHANRKEWLPGSPDSIEAALDRRISEFRVEKATFPLALEAFGKAYGIPTATEPTSATNDKPFANQLLNFTRITLSLHDADGYQALQALLKMATNEAAGRFADSSLQAASVGWTIDDGVLVVRYPFEDDKIVDDTRIYDVRDFLAESRGAAAEIYDGLNQLILENVAPASWRENGGMARFRAANGFLIVTQSPPNHFALRRFLNALRHAGKAPATQPTRLP